jgi:hypothetical protein
MMTQIKWAKVEESTNVHSLFFHEPTQTICVKFHHGGIYSYTGGNLEIYMNLKMAPSVGRYLNNVVKSLPYSRWESEEELANYLHLLV